MSLLLVGAGTVFSQDRKSGGVNLSIWKNIATQRTDTTGSTCLNIGIFSMQNRLNGIGINLMGATTHQEVKGIQLAGIYNVNGSSMNGIQMAGITNVNGGETNGLSFSGLVNITGGSSRGMLFSGLTNIVGGEAKGVVMGGLMNITTGNSSGLHMAGLAHIAGDSFSGLQFSGLLNITGGDLNGLQLSGIGNITAGTARGVQLAPFNVAVRGKGLQIGLVNYYREKLDGFQLGLVNANPDTRVQLMLFGGNTTRANIAARFKNRLFYTILGTGAWQQGVDEKFSTAFFYRAGLELPLNKRFFISGDLGYQHIETFKNKDLGLPARLYALQARANLEYRLTETFGLFVSGGYGTSRHYNRDATFDKGIIVEGGIVLFKY